MKNQCKVKHFCIKYMLNGNIYKCSLHKNGIQSMYLAANKNYRNVCMYIFTSFIFHHIKMSMNRKGIQKLQLLK